MMPTLKITAEQSGTRLDVVLARTYPQVSRSFLQKLVRHGGVRRQGEAPLPGYRVRAGDVFQVVDFESQVSSLGLHGAEQVLTQKRPIPALGADRIPVILFEDTALLVLSKPAGLVVHPAPGHRGATLIEWLRDHLGPKVIKIFTEPERLGLVHRLDKDTSGVLLIAKSVAAQTALGRQFHDRTVRKTYAAFVEGVPSAGKGVISAPVGRSRKQPNRMAVSSQGRPSETAFEVKEALKEVAQVALFPKTGRTHQIRVHAAAIGHPIVGDRTYGSKAVWGESFGVTRSLLHAQRLELSHPLSRKPVSFEAPWPDDFLRAQRVFRQAFKVLWIAVVLAGMSRFPLGAEGTASATSKKAAAPNAGRSTSASSYRLLKKEMAAFKDEIDALKAELLALESALAQLNVSKRLGDLEHAIPEVNAKAVGASNAAEEAKTQMLETSRKVKGLQEALDQARDLVDRLQREVIQYRSQRAPGASSPSEGEGEKP